MINQLEIPMFLEDALPEMHLMYNGKQDAYGAMTQLAAFTDKQIKQHNYNTVRRCFSVAEKLYRAC